MTGYPSATREQLSVLQTAQEIGSVHLLDLTEDDYDAVGWSPPSRGDLIRAGAHRRPDDPSLAPAAAGLVARGLATEAPSDLGPLTAAGDLLVYLTLARSNPSRLGTLVSFLQPEPSRTSRHLHRIMLLREAFGGAVACVERKELPLPNDPQTPLAVRVDLLRYDRLIDLICDVAFRGPNTPAERSAAQGVVTNVGWGEPIVPSRLSIDWSTGTAVLAGAQKKLFGRGSREAVVTREEFAEHLMARLLTGE